MEFVKKDRYYELVLHPSVSFNIHIERDRGGHLAIYRRTSGTRWDLLAMLPRDRPVIDIDVANYMQRDYRVECDVLPTLCRIRFADGTSEDVQNPDGGGIPNGYEPFLVTEGVFFTSDGPYYVKLK